MFVSIKRLLPSGPQVDCLINVDSVLWLQAYPEVQNNGAVAYLMMANGVAVDTVESLQRVAEKLTRR